MVEADEAKFLVGVYFGVPCREPPKEPALDPALELACELPLKCFTLRYELSPDLKRRPP